MGVVEMPGKGLHAGSVPLKKAAELELAGLRCTSGKSTIQESSSQVLLSKPLSFLHQDYLQYSRAFFLISVFTILVVLGWLFSSCLPRRGRVTGNLDLKVSMLSFISASCLLLCLILFLEQVDLYTSETVDSALLWPYQVNWGSDFIYLFAGIVSFLNYITSRSPSLDQDITAVPTEKSRLGFGPVTLPVEDALSELLTESSSEISQTHQI